jgi:anti-sigma28 factor (negative regulator of flagellin synthesis)
LPKTLANVMRIGAKTDAESSRPSGAIGIYPARLPRRARLRDGDDAVQVSVVARAFVRLMGPLDDTRPDPVRAAQVEILRNAVATGRYQPDPIAVARKLLAEVAAELGG